MKLLQFLQPKPDPEPEAQPQKKKRVIHCKLCGYEGHNSKTCPNKQQPQPGEPSVAE